MSSTFSYYVSFFLAQYRDGPNNSNQSKREKRKPLQDLSCLHWRLGTQWQYLLLHWSPHYLPPLPDHTLHHLLFHVLSPEPVHTHTWKTAFDGACGHAHLVVWLTSSASNVPPKFIWFSSPHQCWGPHQFRPQDSDCRLPLFQALQVDHQPEN